MHVLRCPFAAALLLFAAFSAAQLRAADPQIELDFFESRIRPVLVEHCYECHSTDADALQGGLLVDSREGLRRGGDSGAAVVPGDIDESLLLGALKYESFEMPPQGKLPDHVIADFERWIDGGAHDPRDGTAPVVESEIDLEAGRRHWSFQPITRPTVPPVQAVDWPRTDIDRFVLAGLEEHGLAPNANADRRTLVRRLYFDLIGLPPTPAEIASFLDDDAPDAWPRLIDRLLDRPQFGERWGRHWLDVVRFAESTGGGRTRIMPQAWRYRDYVVAALNRDKPFDRFAIEQIAGDLLPHDSFEQRADQLTATSFLALGPSNYELQDKALLTMEIVDEQISTIGAAFLGMTIGCARCHDHKFDPIPTRDYYALAGIFRSTQTVEHSNVSNWIERPLPVEPQRQAELDRHAAEVAQVQAQRDRAQAAVEQKTAELLANGGEGRVIIDDAQASVRGEWTASRSVRNFVGEHYLHAAGSSDGANVVAFEPELPAAGSYEVLLAYTAHGNRASNALVRIDHADGPTQLKVNQRQTPPIAGLYRSLGKFRFADTARVAISDRDANGHVIADAVQFVRLDGPAGAAEAASAESRRLTNELQQVQQEFDQLQKRLSELQRDAPPPPVVVMSVRESDQIEDCPLHIRGSSKNLGEPVPRGYLSVAVQSPLPVLPSTASGRRELAEWIASADNPLTARVFVNRVWGHLFGEGLVRTPDNFGTIGAPPTHPELLDHLAVQFIADGWSVKTLIRSIVNSRVYQLSSEPHDLSLAIDPANRWLWRMNRRRLEAEAIHDAMLAVSGDLDLAVGGSLISGSLRSEFGYQFDGTRRSIYVPVFRNTMHDLFEVFDVANPNLVSGQRSVSTLPTQALYLMNSPLVMNQSRQAAARLLDEACDDTCRIELAFERTLGRPPQPAELAFARDFLRIGSAASATPAERLERWARFQQTLFACLDFRYVK